MKMQNSHKTPLASSLEATKRANVTKLLFPTLIVDLLQAVTSDGKLLKSANLKYVLF